ncbi:TonB-dependent receptor [Sphingomonas aliaeris]|uniref:TonB-dependent receptor n=1 Tax=Sphingomonas aliaeris TaxID=2759526 RepID=A0A974NSC4_9SPHN|nr:TonB-dependent receptor [Sphingomonas aliaeris]QQV75991.1 TonB-dependent receptor [Sphingomonas aliaeris]
MFRHAMLMVGVAPLALIAATAQAQIVPSSEPTATTPATDQATAAEPDQEIIVVGTAGGGTRRQDAAFAVTTISNEAIARAAPNSTADLLRTVPGISAESSGGQNGANIFVRGYPSGGDAQFVTFQVAGVPVFPPSTLSFLENSQLIRLDETVQRVEAVRGGTGSLFSNGQPGLTVNVVQRTGGKDFHGLAKVSYTDFDEIRGDAWVSGPLGEDTGFMVGGYYAQGNGLRDPQFRAEKGGQVTANIHHDFGNKGSVEVYARYLNDRGQWLLPIPIVVGAGGKISEYPGFDHGSGALAGRETRITTNVAGQRVDLADGRGAKVINTGLSFDYELADGLRFRERMSYLGGRADTTGLVPSDAPISAAQMAINLGGAGSTVNRLSYVNGGGTVTTGAGTQVLRAGIWTVDKKLTSYVADTAMEWSTGSNKLTGGFYYANYTTRDTWALGNQVLLAAEPNARLLNLTLDGGRTATQNGFTSGPGFIVNAYYEGSDYAAYGVDEFQITPELRVDGGVRWQQHVVDGTIRTPAAATVNLDGNALTLYDNAVSVFGSPRQVNYNKSEWSWTAGVNYDFTRQIGAFARYSRGNSFPQFDNLREGLTNVSQVDTYEGGVKVSTSLLNLYATVFHNKFGGLATVNLVSTPTNPTPTPVTAVGGAKATGVEMEGVLRPFRGFSLTAAGTYLDATYRGFFTGNGAINNTGNRVQRQPRWTWRVTPALDVDVGGFKPSLFATLQYTGDRFSDPENQQVLPNFYQLDAGVSVDISDRLRLAVTGNNLTDELGLTEGNPRIIGGQGTGAILARPILGRSFRFSASAKF